MVKLNGMDGYGLQIAISGITFDSGVSSIADSTNGKPFMALLEPGNVYVWSKVFDSNYGPLILARFSDSKEQITALNDRSPLWVLVLSTKDGSLINSKLLQNNTPIKPAL